jgi:hypothetical protein
MLLLMALPQWFLLVSNYHGSFLRLADLRADLKSLAVDNPLLLTP